MPRIDVDFDVIAELGQRGKFGDTFNDVIRQALGMPRLEFRVGGLQLHNRGSLAPILEAGLLRPEQRLTWERRNLGETHLATVTADGRMMTRNGASHVSPDTCASAVAGYPCKGWRQWRTEDGKTLQELLEKISSDATGRHGHQS